MKKVAFAVIIILASFNGKTQSLSTDNGFGYTINEAPESESGKLFENILDRYKGKDAYVCFWSPTCIKSLDMIWEITSLEETIKSDSVVFIYITNEMFSYEAWREALPDMKGEHYRLSVDEWNNIYGELNVPGLPYLILADKNGSELNINVKDKKDTPLKELIIRELSKKGY